jgi:hypothetical protein
MDSEQHDIKRFFEQFQDYAAPKLDTYEQAIYLYIYRHSRLLGLAEAVIPFKSARTRMALGLGQAGSPMSESSAYERIDSLEQKGFITVVQTEHRGRRIRLHLPDEIAGVVPTSVPVLAEQDLDAMDFFSVPENRLAILRREGHRCFYTLRPIDENSFVVDHVVSRPAGGNGYRNVVAASREANNKKGATAAEDFLRRLFRDGYLSDAEFEDRMAALVALSEGRLRPVL